MSAVRLMDYRCLRLRQLKAVYIRVPLIHRVTQKSLATFTNIAAISIHYAKSHNFVKNLNSQMKLSNSLQVCLQRAV